jgi:hypothetical protein
MLSKRHVDPKISLKKHLNLQYAFCFHNAFKAKPTKQLSKEIFS